EPILAGGIPRGNLILVEGAAGTGKTTFGVEFIYRGARDFDEPGVIVQFEVSPDRIMREAAHFGWDLSELERSGRIRIIFTTRQLFEQELQQADSLLLEQAREIGARRLFVDSFAPPSAQTDGAPSPRDTFHVLAEALQREGLTAVMAVEVPAHEEARLAAAPHEEFGGGTIIPPRVRGVPQGGGNSTTDTQSAAPAHHLRTHPLRRVDVE